VGKGRRKKPKKNGRSSIAGSNEEKVITYKEKVKEERGGEMSEETKN